MAYAPLTQEQYQKALNAGFSPSAIIEMEKIRKAQGGGLPQTQQLSAPKSRNVIQKLSTGFAKGGTSTFLGLGQIGQGIQRTVGQGIDTLTGGVTHLADTAKGGIFDPSSRAGMKARQIATPENLEEQLGFGFEQALEFFAPAGLASSAETALTKAVAAPTVKGALTRIAGKAAIQGTAAGAVRYAQTGGDIKEAGATALTAGAVRGAMATGGEVIRAFRFPERLMTPIFKNTKADVLDELNSEALTRFKAQDPARFQQLVDSGVIRLGKNGAPLVNDTLAESAIQRGLKGDIRKMATTVIRGSYESEDALRVLAKRSGETLSVPEKQYQNVLKEIAEDYQNVGFGEISAKANSLLNRISAADGKISIGDGIELRRFLDGLRTTRSYDVAVTKMSLSQSNLKTLADTVRARLANIPGVAPIMKDYNFYIDALDALAAEARRLGNAQVLGLIDNFFLGMSAGSSNIAPLGVALARRALLSPMIRTNTAVGLSQQALGPLGSGLVGAGSNALRSLTSPQGQTGL